MAAMNPENANERDRLKRIDELKRRAKKAAGGDIVEGGAEAPSPELEEPFWESVVAWEEAPWTTDLERLESTGMKVSPPDQLDDRQVSSRLWELIQRLARLSVFLENTDHLSDRELYAWLWAEGLREDTKALAGQPGMACHLSPIGGCSDEDNYIYLKYYADEVWRKKWRKDFPDDLIPTREDPPYHRDCLLPQAHEDPPDLQ